MDDRINNPFGAGGVSHYRRTPPKGTDGPFPFPDGSLHHPVNVLQHSTGSNSLAKASFQLNAPNCFRFRHHPLHSNGTLRSKIRQPIANRPPRTRPIWLTSSVVSTLYIIWGQLAPSSRSRIRKAGSTAVDQQVVSRSGAGDVQQ